MLGGDRSVELLGQMLEKCERSGFRAILSALDPETAAQIAADFVYRDTHITLAAMSRVRHGWSEVSASGFRAMLDSVFQSIEGGYTSRVRNQLADGLVFIAQKNPSCGRQIAATFIGSRYRSIRQKGFKLASDQQIRGFEDAIIRELQTPVKWVTECAVRLLDEVRIRTNLEVLWTHSRFVTKLALVQRGMLVDAAWIEDLRPSDPLGWLRLRIETDRIPEDEEWVRIFWALQSESKISYLFRMLAMARKPELIVQLSVDYQDSRYYLHQELKGMGFSWD